jgi:choline dehydrogenase
LLEAGPDFPGIQQLPAVIREAYGGRNHFAHAFGPDTKYGWGYRARFTDQATSMFVPRGKIMGGSSAVNAQIYLRGVPEDYDSWAEAGNELWSYEKLLPFFRLNEADPDFADTYHGVDGPIRLHRFRETEWAPEHRAFYEACRGAGFPDCPDHNHPASTGIGPLPFNNAERIRWSAAIGYLDPARERANLTIKSDCLVHRVLFENRCATRVLVESKGEIEEIRGGEILLCAGAIGSPHTLMLSGIGPADHLQEMGIPVVADVPGVGQNLRDHPQVPIFLRSKQEFLGDGTQPRMQMGLRYTASGFDLRNDMFVHSYSFATEEGTYIVSDSEPFGFGITACIYLAFSKGEIKLASADARERPVLDYNLLSESGDRQRLREGVRMVIDLLADTAFRDIVIDRIGPTEAELTSDQTIDDWMEERVVTSHHVSATCKMGPGTDSMAVVDQQGHVRGVDGLRVADASIMPDCVRANTNATAMIIGERIADLMI